MPDRSESAGGCAAGILASPSASDLHIRLAIKTCTWLSDPPRLYESTVLLACHENQKKGTSLLSLSDSYDAGKGKWFRGDKMKLVYTHDSYPLAVPKKQLPPKLQEHALYNT